MFQHFIIHASKISAVKSASHDRFFSLYTFRLVAIHKNLKKSSNLQAQNYISSSD